MWNCSLCKNRQPHTQKAFDSATGRMVILSRSSPGLSHPLPRIQAPLPLIPAPHSTRMHTQACAHEHALLTPESGLPLVQHTPCASSVCPSDPQVTGPHPHSPMAVPHPPKAPQEAWPVLYLPSSPRLCQRTSWELSTPLIGWQL